MRLTVGRLMIVVALASMALGGYVAWRAHAYCRLTVVNRSGRPIARLTIDAWGERSEIKDLADGDSATVPFWGGRGTRFAVNGLLADDTRVGTSFKLTGDPRRFAGLTGTVTKEGRFRLSLHR